MPLLLQDRRLLDAFRRGERQALERVYRHYFDDVYRLASHGFFTKNGLRVPAIVNESDRLDLVQDIFIKAFGERARMSYDGLGPYRPFLMQLARNLRIDGLRRSGRELSESQFQTAEGDALNLDALIESNRELPSLAPEDQLAWKQLRAETLNYLNSVDPECRQLVECRFVEELSQAETAKRLGTTRRRVRTLEAGVVQGLRRHLDRLRPGQLRTA